MQRTATERRVFSGLAVRERGMNALRGFLPQTVQSEPARAALKLVAVRLAIAHRQQNGRDNPYLTTALNSLTAVSDARVAIDPAYEAALLTATSAVDDLLSGAPGYYPQGGPTGFAMNTL